MKNYTVIILASGKGLRADLGQPKQFAKIKGKILLEYSIDVFLEIGMNVILTLPKNSVWNNKNKYKDVLTVEGGETRSESLRFALKHVSTKFTLIHDSSRPFVDKRLVKKLIEELDKYSCVYPTLPISSSIVVDKNDMLQSTPDRQLFKEIQTPQGFNTNRLKLALQQFGEAHIHIPELIRWLGDDVKHIDGSPWLFKITYKPDYYAAEKYLELFK